MSDVPKQVIDLIERFERNIESYRQQNYNESQVRQEFINPFFEALGWDVANRAGYAEAYKDVIHEDAIKIGSAIKAPDYCFRIGGVRKFFLEAKKPSVRIKDDASPAYQIRRYAWSAKLPLSILTDFEEFAVYDCRIRPLATDKPGIARIKYFTYQEYISRWEEIASVFSKEAVMRGSFDKFASGKGRRGTLAVDVAFLTEIEAWRDTLARNLALRNPNLTVRELNFSVQKTIDRVIFLRMCEDRGIELYGQLMALLNGVNVYQRLRHIYALADDRYNSGLFHFKSEKGRPEAPDELTPALIIDDKVLKEIIRRLYYPESPYEFSVLSADILGNVYEQFLGKVIRLTAGHRAVIEEKPEVKKAGGVYYTPTYIVEYIVKNTVGKFCERKTPRQISKLRILDPACGSGSFLIGAYTYLLNYHRDWYVKDGPQKHTKEIYQGKGGQWLLTTQEKRRILLNNIYGVDIDSQAVEVTKLSLLLKVLEGENQDSLNRQLKMWRERALPDLGSNIKCGNSLIGPDYYEGEQTSIFDDEESRRVNPFDWRAEFPTIFSTPGGKAKSKGREGFDAVIGNPPYVRIQTMKEWAPIEVELYKQHYSAASKGNYDIYVVFVEKGLQLLNKAGRLGFILPHKFFNAQYGEPLRKLISQGKHLTEAVHFGDQQVFAGATTYTCLLFLDKEGAPQADVQKVNDLEAWENANVGAINELPLHPAETGKIPAQSITSSEWNFVIGAEKVILEKLKGVPLKLGDIAHTFVGTQTSADHVFVLDRCRQVKNYIIGVSKSLKKEVKVEATSVKPFLRGKEIRRYRSLEANSYLICPYEISDNSFRLFTQSEMLNKFPLAWSYLAENKTLLNQREKGKLKGQNWYAFGYPKSMTLFRTPKIVVPDYNNEASFTFDSSEYFYKTGYGIIIRDQPFSELYVLGLLNSSLLFYYLLSIGTSLRGGYVRFWTQYIDQLPIRVINLSNPSDKDRHDKMVSLVNRIQDLHKRLPPAKTPDEKTRLQRQINATDTQIDQLVYELYGLTEEEISIVEGTSVDSKTEKWDNQPDEKRELPENQSRRVKRQASGMAEAAQYTKEGGGSAPKDPSGPRRPVDGVRERTGRYGPSQDPPEEEGNEPIESTRLFETAEGSLSYPQVSERLAVALAGILKTILQTSPDQIVITPESVCLHHQALAGDLFPDWAGRYRDLNVQVGAHTPPPFFEVPGLMRLFCDDLAERLCHAPPDGSNVDDIADLLAWVDWRFQWIHPFRDFNGRIGRVLLAVVLYKLALPHIETAPIESDARRQYLEALRAADQGDLVPLTDLWIRRIGEAL